MENTKWWFDIFIAAPGIYIYRILYRQFICTLLRVNEPLFFQCLCAYRIIFHCSYITNRAFLYKCNNSSLHTRAYTDATSHVHKTVHDLSPCHSPIAAQDLGLLSELFFLSHHVSVTNRPKWQKISTACNWESMGPAGESGRQYRAVLSTWTNRVVRTLEKAKLYILSSSTQKLKKMKNMLISMLVYLQRFFLGCEFGKLQRCLMKISVII